jgi:hypothetical protein
MWAKAAVFTRVTYGAFNFGGVRGSTRGLKCGVSKVVAAIQAAGDVGIESDCRGVQNVILPITQSINKL